jgi:hypothetical protein
MNQDWSFYDSSMTKSNCVCQRSDYYLRPFIL